MQLSMYNGREGSGEFRQMSLAEVLDLDSSSHCWVKNNKGSAVRVKINGRVKRWKREPERFSVPVKYGLYECARLENADLDRFVVPM